MAACDVGIGAKPNIQKRSLSPFKKDFFALSKCLTNLSIGIMDVGFQCLAIRQMLFEKCLDLKSVLSVVLEEQIFFVEILL